jgi:hypothetical protein
MNVAFGGDVAYYAIDRIEGQIAVLVGDDGMSVDVPKRVLPAGVREGSVLQVQIGKDSTPDWSNAVLDEAERERRVKEGRETLDRLRKRDPGGDITL